MLAVRLVLGRLRASRIIALLLGAMTVVGFVWFVYDKATEHSSPPAPFTTSSSARQSQR